MLTPYSNFDHAIGQILVKTGYLKSVEKRVIGKKNFLEVNLKYHEKKPVMTDFRLISKPSRHLYSTYRDLRPVRQHFGLAILSTPKGAIRN